MFGTHLIQSWSNTQPSISLSSGEAEYYGVVKAAGIALGHLFTKHLTFRDRLHQLIELFNCEYRDSRSAAAPELRKDRESAAIHAVQHEHDPDANNRSRMHEPDILPHMHDAKELSKTSEIAVAPAELDCAPTG